MKKKSRRKKNKQNVFKFKECLNCHKIIKYHKTKRVCPYCGYRDSGEDILSNDVIAKIKKMIEEDLTQADIARHYGVSRERIRQIIVVSKLRDFYYRTWAKRRARKENIVRKLRVCRECGISFICKIAGATRDFCSWKCMHKHKLKGENERVKRNYRLKRLLDKQK